MRLEIDLFSLSRSMYAFPQQWTILITATTQRSMCTQRTQIIDSIHVYVDCQNLHYRQIIGVRSTSIYEFKQGSHHIFRTLDSSR